MLGTLRRPTGIRAAAVVFGGDGKTILVGTARGVVLRFVLVATT